MTLPPLRPSVPPPPPPPRWPITERAKHLPMGAETSVMFGILGRPDRSSS